MDSASIGLPGLRPAVAPATAGVACPDPAQALSLYRSMVMARTVDRVEMELVNRGEGFFHVGGAGHEASVALAPYLVPADYLYPHYRDKSLMLARGVPPEQFFHGLLCTAGSTSAGRQMGAHLSVPEVRILPMTGPVGNNALPSTGVAHEILASIRRAAAAGTSAPSEGLPPGATPLVLCSGGDSSAQQGEFLEAVAEAVRASLPVLFLIEDNGYAISTRTEGNTFFKLPGGPAREFYGLPIHRMDGRDVLACLAALGPIVAAVRSSRPAIVVMEVDRLTHHTNADDERVYRPEPELKRVRAASDPIARLRAALRDRGVAEADLARLEAEIEAEVRDAAARALVAPAPANNFDARPPAALDALAPAAVAHGSSPAPVTPAAWTMLEAIRGVLRRQLAADPRVTLFGEDIEDPKGDVFGVTRGLSRDFPGQVSNSALTESTILGVSIGRAMAGGRPVACIQFADFLPLAFNQMASELSSIHWRTAGGWQTPVIVLAPCGAYRPGLGPYHAHTYESVIAHLPGVDVVMPSSAADAAGLLNAAFANQSTGRPTVFLYPKVCLNDPALAAPPSALDQVIQPGVARFLTRGAELTLVTWGSTVPLCLRAAQALGAAGIGVDLIDLRSLSPWDPLAVTRSVEQSRRLIVVHEDNLVCGFGAEVVSTVSERAAVPFQSRRITRGETFPPTNYVNQIEVLPNLKRILVAAAELCGLDLAWEEEAAGEKDVFVVEAVGSSPADQSVSVVEWKTAEGATIAAGDLLADCEADKATFELRAPVGGILKDLLAVDQKVPIGSPLARIVTPRSTVPAAPRRIPVEPKPRITRRPPVRVPTRLDVVVPDHAIGRRVKIGISTVAAAPAGRVVTNEELVQRFPGRVPHDIFQRTGIESRRILAPGETAASLAARAAREALAGVGVGLADLDAIYVSTSTPISISPSMACLLHHALAGGGPTRDIQASDILAACSGYLYALQAAFDFCRSKPDANILVVTAEAMSEFTDPNDFDTAIVFGDAATATLVHGPSSPLFGRCRAHLHRPVLSARGEDGTILHHGRKGSPAVNMDGLKVFPMAVRQLIALLKQACAESEVAVEDLSYIIPHQANGRILDAVDQRLKLPKGRLVNRVIHSGNTSSSTIPLVLAELLQGTPAGMAGLCAFGGGFTFGAAVMEWLDSSPQPG